MEMRHLKLILRYRGTAYHGFQVQKNALSVAEVVQNAVQAVFKERLDIKGCSRTDTGVHANQYVITLRTKLRIPCDAVVRAMNANLPKDIAVCGCEEVPQDFHPRYSCKAKRYLYKIHNGPVRDPFLSDLALYQRFLLDAGQMDAAAKGFIGEYDFSAFCSAGSSVKDTVRIIYDAQVERRGEQIVFSVTGNGFLYNMVRIMAGTLLEASGRKLGAQDIRKIILSGARENAGITAPAHGLYLDQVFYDDEGMFVPPGGNGAKTAHGI